MTGLDPRVDRILEIACFVTDANLNLLDPAGFHATVTTPVATLDAMGSWCREHHDVSGLSAAAADPACSAPAPTVAAAIGAYIRRLVPQSRTALLAGSSVHADRQFLAADGADTAAGGVWQAAVLDWLHPYRLLDVSAWKEGVARWASDELLAAAPRKKGVHRASDDVLESISEMRFYRQALFGAVGAGS